MTTFKKMFLALIIITIGIAGVTIKSMTTPILNEGKEAPDLNGKKSSSSGKADGATGFYFAAVCNAHDRPSSRVNVDSSVDSSELNPGGYCVINQSAVHLDSTHMLMKPRSSQEVVIESRCRQKPDPDIYKAHNQIAFVSGKKVIAIVSYLNKDDVLNHCGKISMSSIKSAGLFCEKMRSNLGLDSERCLDMCDAKKGIDKPICFVANAKFPPDS